MRVEIKKDYHFEKGNELSAFFEDNKDWFPQFLIRDNKCYEGSELFAANRSIYNGLDNQAIHTIETIIRVEFARCNNPNAELAIEWFHRGTED